MRTPDDRWAELCAAALAGELSPAETVEFDELRRDARRADEYEGLREITARLRQGDLAWTPPRDDSDLEARIAASIARAEGETTEGPRVVEPARRPWRPWLVPTVAAACLLGGLVIGANGAALVQPSVPSGPPGTLGAVERLAVTDDDAGVDVDAQVVAHTWGTEAYLEATGLNVGATYELVFVGADGTEFSAGEVLGSEVPIVCRMNAAVPRSETVRLELRDTQRSVVAHADLPSV
ncbi:hypothetical protein [uncultured Microbacterium sp.]|uniref:hypothetical protein n=1 Tax=uncultured Microbacterium sp. TaxID=191216 RepID=UPI0025DC4636|nr:hypothetical protein [uncultured Microbacterium sp.]